MPTLATTLEFQVDADHEKRPEALAAIREAKTKIEALGIEVTQSSRAVVPGRSGPRAARATGETRQTAGEQSGAGQAQGDPAPTDPSPPTKLPGRTKAA